MPGRYEIIAPATLADLLAARADAAGRGDDDAVRAADHAALAAAAANTGDLEAAKCGLAEALAAAGPRPDLRLLFLAFQFFFRNGDLDQAERLARRRIELAEPVSPPAARAWSNLGLVQHTRADYDAAAASCDRAVAIDRLLGDDYGLSRDLGNAALVPESRGDLDRAEAIYLEALAIAERIGADDLIATKLANLGDIALRRGQGDRARELWTRAVQLLARTGHTKARDEVAAKLAGLE